MDLLRGFTKRAPSPPGSAAAAGAAAVEDSPGGEFSAEARLLQLSQDIYLEEDRHQQAMMALESSVFGCGSDDWSVDSDYAFQDFADDVKQHQPIRQQHQENGKVVQPSTPTPERRYTPVQGTPSRTGLSGSFEAGRTEGLVELGSVTAAAAVGLAGEEAEAKEEAAEAAAVTNTAQVGGERATGVGETLTLRKEASGRGDTGQDSGTGSGGDETRRSWPANARLFGDSGTSTDNTHILRLEQRMFLKAAFQLLEERDRLLPASIGAWNNAAGGWAGPSGGGGGGSGGSNLRDQQGDFIHGGAVYAGKVGDGARFQFKHEHSFHANRPRIIKSGTLRKATARSVGRLEKTTWKNKYVELTPGSFAYSDNGPNVLGKSRSAKVIPLHQGFCTCRSVKTKHRVTRSRNSIILSNLARPNNHQDARGASGASCGGIEGIGAGGTGGGTSKHLLEIEVVGLKRRVWAAESKQECRRWVSAIKGAMTERPVNPDETVLTEDQLPIIPHDSCHRHHMERYISLRSILRNAESTEDYLTALEGLMAAAGTSGSRQTCGEDNSMGVPVKWVKQQLPGSERAYQAPGRGRGKSELAQLWKDMKRDTVSINGRVMTGEQGPEGIIGALTRCILAQAGRLPGSDSLSKLSEAQSLLAARDVLLACDRTTSGGDTYLVVDNLCRNPPLVVLVPASQEAEPLDITVTLHPRAAQAKLPPQPQPWSPSPLSLGHKKARARASGSPVSTFASPARLLEPPSPSSITSVSPATSPSFGSRKGRPKHAVGATRCDYPIASAAGGIETGAGREEWRDGRGVAPEAQRKLVGEGETGAAPPTSKVGKRRGRLKIRGAGKARLTRAGSATGGRPTQAMPAVPGMRQVASWDGTQDLAAILPTERPWAENKGGAVASPTAEQGAGLGGTGASGRAGGDVGDGTGGLFASFSRRRSGQADARGVQSGGGRLNTKPQGVQPAVSAREGNAGVKGGETGDMRGGLRSAPAGGAAAPGSYKMFFGDTDDGGDESGSSDDGDGGALSRKSFIRVDCAARTSYKLFSSDPQDEERDVFALVTGLFEQSFTIAREFPSASGSRASSGIGSATRTEGSIAFLNFHQPTLKRQSLNKSESAGRIKEAAAAEDTRSKTEAVDTIAKNRDLHDDASKSGRLSLKLSDDESDGYDGDHGVGDGFAASARGARISFSCDDLAVGPALEEHGTGARLRNDSFVDVEVDVKSTDGPLDSHASDGTDRSAVGYALDDERGQSEPGDTKTFANGIDRGEATYSEGSGLGQCAEEAAPSVADSEVEGGTLAATAALTPDSAGPLHFSPGSAAARSTNGSMSETPTSPAAALSSPSCRTGVERKVSRVAGLFRRFSSREMASPDPVDALRVEPLDFDFDDAHDARPDASSCR